MSGQPFQRVRQLLDQADRLDHLPMSDSTRTRLWRLSCALFVKARGGLKMTTLEIANARVTLLAIRDEIQLEGGV